MYVNIFRKGSAGLFQKHFASISETQFQKELCHNLNFQKNKYELKNQKTEIKLKEKQGVISIFLYKLFKKKRRKPQEKQQNNNVWVKPQLKNRADSNAYNNLLQMHILRPKSVKSLKIIHFPSNSYSLHEFSNYFFTNWIFIHKNLLTKYSFPSSQRISVVQMTHFVGECFLFSHRFQTKS